MSRILLSSSGAEIKIESFFMLSNNWEYFVLENGDDAFLNSNPDYKRAIVWGFEVEMGDIHLSEVNKYIIPLTKTTDLSHVLPPEGYIWKN